jgi:hypothetical protein
MAARAKQFLIDKKGKAGCEVVFTQRGGLHASQNFREQISNVKRGSGGRVRWLTR